MEYKIIMVGGELSHHGVPGMKWGHRKAPVLSGAKARMTEIKKNNYDKSPAHIKKSIDYRQKQSTGKKLVKDILLSPSGVATYDMARAYGESRGKAWVRSWLDINGSTIVSGMAGTAAGSITKGNRGAVTGASMGVGYATRYADLSLQQRALRKKYEKQS